MRFPQEVSLLLNNFQGSVTRHSTKCVDFSLAFLGLGGDFLGRDFEGLFRRDASVEQVAKTRNLFFSKKEKILRPREKRKHQSPSVVVKTQYLLSIFSLSVSTHTPNSSLLFRTQWLLFPPPRYACNAILFFSRSSAVRVGGSLPRFRPTRYFSPLIIEKWMCA